jgi:hypothetical protein
MKTQFLLALIVLLLASGCVVAPAPGPVAVAPPGVVVPAGVVYVAPTYAVPAPGYTWRYNARYGWGWYHPTYGWHRGWH